jgi:hypothetical protein
MPAHRALRVKKAIDNLAVDIQLPIRTGREFRNPRSHSTSHSISCRSPCRPYMICNCSGLPAKARNSHFCHAAASSKYPPLASASKVNVLSRNQQKR